VDEDLVSAMDRAELTRRLAEQGVPGAQDLLKEAEARGGRLGQRLASLRERLRRQVTRQTHRLLEEYRRKGEALDAAFVKRRASLESELARLRASQDRAASFDPRDLLVDASLLEAVQRALILPDEALKAASREPRKGWWARLVAALRRFVEALLRLLRRTPRQSPPTREAPGRPLPLGRLATLGRTLTPQSAESLVESLTPAQREALARSARQGLAERGQDLKAEMDRLEEERRRALQRTREEAELAGQQARAREDPLVKERVEARLKEELRERGLVRERSGALAVTYALVERFARLVLEEESRALPEGLRASLQGAASTGQYEKGRLRQSDEVARLDLVGSLVESRLHGSRHLNEETSYVYREIRAESLHAVLLLDTSGSMSEGGKLAAAKKAFLALYMAVRRRYPDATIDVATFDNEVRVRDLLSLWEASPGAFTNTGEALKAARDLLAGSRASRKELYLITDGLPEAYTDRNGVVHSGNLKLAQASALEHARELRRVGPLVSTIVLLKSSDPSYEKAARELAQGLGGSVVITDPRRLAFELLIRFVGGRVEEKAPRAAEGPWPAPGTRGADIPAGADTARARRARRRARAAQEAA